MSTPASSTNSSARVFVIIAIVLDVVALLFLPIILGPIGAVLGFVGYAQGDKKFGLWAGIGGIVATILGLVIAAVVINSNN